MLDSFQDYMSMNKLAALLAIIFSIEIIVSIYICDIEIAVKILPELI